MAFGKKSGMSELEKKAKLAALGGAHAMASDALKEKLGGLKKVSVLSNSKNGLAHGLKTAEELIGGSKMEEDGDNADSRVHSNKERSHYLEDENKSLNDHDGSDHPDMEDMMGAESESGDEESSDPMEDSESQDEESLDAKIAHLMSMKAKMKHGRG